MKKMKAMLLTMMSTVMCATMSLPVCAVEEQPTVSIPVEVTLEGTQPAQAEKFVITLKADDAEWDPMPEGSTDGEATLTITGEGEAEFSGITYDTVGLYTYTVTQSKGSYDKCKYDDTVYTLEVYVTNSENGGLAAQTALYPNGEEPKADKVTFHNVYETVIKVPDTGDTSNYMMYAGIACAAVAALGVLFFVRRKYSER